MPQPCTICTHTSRPEIDRLIVSGEPNQRVATKFGVTESAIRRHRASHLPQALAKAQAAKGGRPCGIQNKAHSAATGRTAGVLPPALAGEDELKAYRRRPRWRGCD
jgi:hypothetical protein